MRAAKNKPAPWTVDALFVYGTVMRGEVRHTYLQRASELLCVLCAVLGIIRPDPDVLEAVERAQDRVCRYSAAAGTRPHRLGSDVEERARRLLALADP